MLAELLSELSTYMTCLLGPRVVLLSPAGRGPPEFSRSASSRPCGRTRNSDTLPLDPKSLPALTTNRHELLSPSSLRFTDPMLSRTVKLLNGGGLAVGRPLPPVGKSAALVSWPFAARLYAITRFSGAVFDWVNTAPGVSSGFAACALPAVAASARSIRPNKRPTPSRPAKHARPCIALPPVCARRTSALRRAHPDCLASTLSDVLGAFHAK